MRLPSILLSSYKRYKDDTDHLATWLAHTARELGFSGLLTHSTHQDRVKKKGDSQRKVISTDLFLVLAQFIADHDPPVPVPVSVLSATKRTIKNRQQAYDFYSSVKNAKKRIDNSHLDFISKLQDVLSLLKKMFIQPRPAPKASVVKSAPTFPVPASEHSLASSLPSSKKSRQPTVEDDEEDDALEAAVTPANAPIIATAPPAPIFEQVSTPLNDAEYEAEPMSNDLEALLAGFYLFADIDKILNFVLEEWDRYADGRLELIPSAMTLNAAVDLVRRLENDFQARFPHSPDEMLDLSRQCLRINTRTTACGRPRQDPGHCPKCDKYSAMQWALDPMFHTLLTMREYFKPNFYEGFNPATDHYNPDADRGAMTADQRTKDDLCLFVHTIPSMLLLANWPQNLLSEDNFTRGMKEMIRGAKPTLWLAFTAMVYLQGHYALGRNVDRGFKQLKRIALATRETAIETLVFHRNLKKPIGSFEGEYSTFMCMILKVDNAVLTDTVYKIGETQFDKDAFPDLPEPYYLLKNSPILCGLYAYQMLEQANLYGLSHCNLWGSLCFAAHLYNAVKEEGSCSTEWPVLDLLIRRHDDAKDCHKIFMTEKPKDKRAYLSQALYAYGYSLTQKGYGITKGFPNAISKNKEKLLIEKIPTCRLFSKRYSNDSEDAFHLNLAEVERYMNDRWESSPNPVEDARVDEATKEKLKASDIDKNKKHYLVLQMDIIGPAHCTQDANFLTPCELLLTIEENIQHELRCLDFDYLRFHRQAWGLLERVKSKLNSTLIEYIGPNYLHRFDHDLPVIVLYLFAIANNKPAVAHKAILKHPSQFLQDKLLSITGSIVEQYIKEMNDKAGDPWARDFFFCVQDVFEPIDTGNIEELKGLKRLCDAMLEKGEFLGNPEWLNMHGEKYQCPRKKGKKAKKAKKLASAVDEVEIPDVKAGDYVFW